MMQDAQTNTDNRSVGELFGDLTREFSTLVRQEVNLAKAEMSAKASKAGKNAGFLAAGGAVAYAGLLTIIAAIVLILIRAGLAPWISALIVGIVVAAIGGYLVKKGLDAFKHMDAAPHETEETLQEDVRWAKQQMRPQGQ